MRFFTVFSVLACGAMALAAAVAPDALAKRDLDISVIIGDLNDKCNDILPKFDDCEDAGCTETLVLEVVAAIELATSECVGVEDEPSDPLAELIADVIIDITVALNDHKSSCGGRCGDLSVYAQVDVSISALLDQLAISIVGIIALVVNLLGGILDILQGLGLTLILQIVL